MRLLPFDFTFLKILAVMIFVLLLVLKIPYAENSLSVLIVKVGLILVLNLIWVLKTGWIPFVRTTVNKVLKKK
jgi:hypothetical protein